MIFFCQNKTKLGSAIAIRMDATNNLCLLEI
ncbi:MAG TPA: hypothetical protein DIW64_11525 [Cellvibrio sp.]|nr:hypothetical protein [Cellvibrio sp.]